ncbi:hypothetical protein BC830DRAFT_1165437 [Chytriomyces sp. MP71]|nr:hypothetical protein BC830DRAFT_1165437 [Chytriomyces sp. MP71]
MERFPFITADAASGSEAKSSAGLTLAFKDLSYSIVDGKTKESKFLIEGISGCVQPGEILAVMGPSGAGKMFSPVAKATLAPNTAKSCSTGLRDQ